jgi:hypothetical protein
MFMQFGEGSSEKIDGVVALPHSNALDYWLACVIKDGLLGAVVQ